MEEENSNSNQDIFLSLKDKYTKVKKMLDQLKEGDNSQLYLKSNAAKTLKSMQESLQKHIDNSEQCDDKLIALLGTAHLNLGLIYNEMEDLKAGEEQCMKCIHILNNIKIQPLSVLSMLGALHKVSIYWSRLDQPNKAKTFLDRAESIYTEYNNTCDDDPVSPNKLFGLDEDNEIGPREAFEKLHTLTLFYLAQIHGILENYIESASYCHATLIRQLQHGDFDSIEWALNAATLSQFFMEKGKFSQTKHHLGAATYILDKYKETLERETSEKEKDGNVNEIEKEAQENEKEALAAKWENFNHRSADVARCWAKYGILLLSSSKDRLVRNVDQEEEKLSSSMTDVDLNDKDNALHATLNDLKFTSIEKEVDMITADITDRFLLDFEDARGVFLKIQKWLEDAKKYYTFENHASDYVQIIQDMSQAYKYLAFFEEDDERRAKMHKRRVDILEEVAKELNPKYYQASCREIWLELGETYSQILNLKLDRLRSMEERPPPRMLSKINNLVTQVKKNFENFLDSLKECYEKPDGTIQFPDELIRPALCSYFHLGRIHNAYITPDKNVQLENTKCSLDAYTFLVNYCEQDSKARDVMTEELSVCKELVKLLPIKIRKLKQEIDSRYLNTQMTLK